MKKKKKSFPKKPALVLTAAALLLVGSTVGSTRAALTYYSENYSAQMNMQSIGVSLLENDKVVSSRDYVSNNEWKGTSEGTLLTNLLGKDETFTPGKKYNDEDNMLVNDLRSIVSKARSKAFAAVNYSLVERNWRIGQRIVEQEQNGASRAEYGKHVIEVASAALTKEFGKGFSETNIKSYRRFYNFFPDLGIGQAVPAQLEKQKQQAVPAIFTALVKEEYQTHFTN